MSDTTFQLGDEKITCRITVPIADKIRDKVGIDLINPQDNAQGIMVLMTDPRRSLEAVFYASDVEDMDFISEHWAGETIEDGVMALWAAVVDFSQPSQRPALEAAMEKIKAGMAANNELALKLIKSEEFQKTVDETMERMGSQLMEQLSEDLSSATPEQLGSILADGRSLS